jgi:formate hydrogenlyase subunit 3/multisubunit Na+/H+ antiporter MnhD subunit
MAAPSQRRALGALFLVLALAFAGIAFAAGRAAQWIILASASAIALWLAGLAARAFRS